MICSHVNLAVRYQPFSSYLRPDRAREPRLLPFSFPPQAVQIYSILIDVIPPRHLGQRLPAATLRMRTPIRGQLWITRFRPAVDKDTTPLLAALLRDRDSLLPPLDWAEARTVRSWQLIVTGIEDLGFSDKAPQLFRQSRWCRVVTDSDALRR